MPHLSSTVNLAHENAAALPAKARYQKDAMSTVLDSNAIPEVGPHSYMPYISGLQRTY